MIDAPRPEPDASLRANAAIDQELDAANALQFERDLASDPALCALHARLGAASEAVRRAAPRERAPAELRARVLRLAEVLEVRSFALDSLRQFSARARRLARRDRHDRRAGLGDPHRWTRRRPAIAGPCFWLYARTGFRSALRRRFVGPSHGKALAREPHNAWRFRGRSCRGGISVGGRAHRHCRPGPGTDLVYRRREHFISVSELPAGRGAQPWRGSVDGFHVERWADSERAYVAVSDLDARDLSAFVEAFRAAQRSGAPSGDPVPVKP